MITTGLGIQTEEQTRFGLKEGLAAGGVIKYVQNILSEGLLRKKT